MQGIMPGACRRRRPRTTWMDNINMDRTPRERVNQNDRGQINGESTFMVWWPILGSRTAKEQNSSLNKLTCSHYPLLQMLSAGEM